MVALILLTIMGCEKEDVVDTEPLIEREYPGDWVSQTFKVQPEGTDVSVFGGLVSLKFPEGLVAAPTLFIISNFPVYHLELDGMNMYDMGLFLEGDYPNQKLKDVSIQVNYDLDPESWKKNAPGPKDENLTIYHVSPDIYAHQTINSIDGCCVDCSSTMIQGCITSCGFYLVGEK
jgi:hypothetical protein